MNPGIPLSALLVVGGALAATTAPQGPVFPAPVVDTIYIASPSAVGDLDGDGFPDMVIMGLDPVATVILSDGAAGFRPQIGIDLPTSLIQDLAIADFDLDGHPDLVSGSGRAGDNLFVQRGRGDGTFEAPQAYAVATRASSVAVADLDEDGRPDLVVSHTETRWLRNLGGSVFGVPQPLAAGLGGGAVEVGDFDGDGHADVAVAGDVVLGQGDGAFGAVWSVGFDEPFVVGDFDGDGRDDLAAATGDDRVQVLISAAGGAFFQALTLPTDGTPKLAVADFDRDGRDDLALAYSAGVRPITVWEGILDPLPIGPRESTIPTGGGQMALLAADFNLDGLPDLAGPIYNAWAGLILQNADGSFEAAARYGVGEYPQAVESADLDGDGNADMVVTNRDSQDVSILLGRGDGSFQPDSPVAAGLAPRAVEIVDLQPDGNPDVVVTDENADAANVLLGGGDGTFTFLGGVTVGAQPAGLAAGFIDGDAFVDLVVANRGGDSVSVLLGHGDGSFAPALDVVSGPAPDDVVIVDVDGQGGADLVVGNFDDTSISVLLGDGQGGFAAPSVIDLGPGSAAPAIEIAAGDLNADGKTDLAVVHGYSLSTLLGNGDGTFAARWLYPEFLRVPGGLRIADIDGNGVPDVVVAHFPWLVRVLEGQGDGTLGPLRGFEGPYYPTGIALGDFDRDGRPDVAVTSRSEPPSVAVSLNGLGVPQLRFADAATLRWPSFWQAEAYRVYRGDLAALVDLDGDGLPETGYGDCAGESGVTSFADEQPAPAPGTGRFYLLEAVGLGGPAGGLGSTSGGLPRAPATVCPD